MWISIIEIIQPQTKISQQRSLAGGSSRCDLGIEPSSRVQKIQRRVKLLIEIEDLSFQPGRSWFRQTARELICAIMSCCFQESGSDQTLQQPSQHNAKRRYKLPRL